MTETRTFRHGRTAHPALIGLTVGALTWIILYMAGNDKVTDPRHVSTNTSVAVLAIMKELSTWVAVGIGGLVCLWAFQKRHLENEGNASPSFMDWSAALPQWKPDPAIGDTGAFVVPLARVESGEYHRNVQTPDMPRSASLALVPAVITDSVPVKRLVPLQKLVARFAAAKAAMPHQPSGLSVVPAGSQGLVRAARVDIPAHLPPNVLRELERYEIERYTGEMFRRQGFDVAAIGNGGPNSSVDLICQRQGETAFIKCARSDDGDISMEAVRELLTNVTSEGATRGIFITTGKFSRKAIKFARSKARGRIELINGSLLGTLLRATAAGAGASPACPCCGGRMTLTRERRWFRPDLWSWDCATESCLGVISQEDVIPTPNRRAA